MIERCMMMLSSILLSLATCAQAPAGGSFDVEYSPSLLIPLRVTWALRPSDLGRTTREPSMKFYEDTSAPVPRANPSDYSRSGYDRGHMCPAADRSYSRDAMRATFIMTNICPQTPALNRGAWKKIEDAARRYVRSGHPLLITADAVFWQADTQRIGAHGVAVPHGFVKTVRLLANDSVIFSRYFQNN